MRRLIGQAFELNLSKLPKLTKFNTKITLSDDLKNKFANDFQTSSYQNGRLNLDSKFLQNQIWTSKNDRKAAFVLHNFESYQIQVRSSCGNINESVEISSGIGQEILKEEWREDIVGNLFYPSDGDRFPAVLHLNGAVPLIQDSRSISIAHKGFVVFELGYNLPDYGQKNFFSHDMKTPYDLGYIRRSIQKILAHPKVYGNRVAVVGQSLGSTLAVATASLMPELVEVSVTNSHHIASPLPVPYSYQGRTWENISFDFSKLGTRNLNGKEFVNNDLFPLSFNNELIFRKENNEWSYDKDIMRYLIKTGFPLKQANKLVHCQTLDDPCCNPTPEIGREINELQFEGIDADLTYAESGHLCILPRVPMIDESVFAFGYPTRKSISKWSRNETDPEKIKEGNECLKIFENLIFSLKKYM